MFTTFFSQHLFIIFVHNSCSRRLFKALVHNYLLTSICSQLFVHNSFFTTLCSQLFFITLSSQLFIHAFWCLITIFFHSVCLQLLFITLFHIFSSTLLFITFVHNYCSQLLFKALVHNYLLQTLLFTIQSSQLFLHTFGAQFLLSYFKQKKLFTAFVYNFYS